MYILTTFIQFSPTPYPAHNNNKSDHFCEFVCWHTIELQHWMSSWCTAYFYTFQNDHHSKSSYHLLLYEAITQLLTIGSTLYILYPWCIYFVTVYLCLLISLSYFFLPPTPSHLATTYLFSASRTLFLFSHVCTFVLFLDSTCQWNHTVFLYLTCFTSHNTL